MKITEILVKIGKLATELDQIISLYCFSDTLYKDFDNEIKDRICTINKEIDGLEQQIESFNTKEK